MSDKKLIKAIEAIKIDMIDHSDTPEEVIDYVFDQLSIYVQELEQRAEEADRLIPTLSADSDKLIVSTIEQAINFWTEMKQEGKVNPLDRPHFVELGNSILHKYHQYNRGNNVQDK